EFPAAEGGEARRNVAEEFEVPGEVIAHHGKQGRTTRCVDREDTPRRLPVRGGSGLQSHLARSTPCRNASAVGPKPCAVKLGQRRKPIGLPHFPTRERRFPATEKSRASAQFPWPIFAGSHVCPRSSSDLASGCATGGRADLCHSLCHRVLRKGDRFQRYSEPGIRDPAQRAD